MNARNKLRGPRSEAEKHANWERQLKRCYGINAEDYYSLLSIVPGCAVCSKTPEENGMRLAVDHDHKTGRVRGLLCKDCNIGIEHLRDGALFPSAAQYLSLQ